MGGWHDRPGYLKRVENFPMELAFFEKLKIFQVGGLWLFHNG